MKVSTPLAASIEKARRVGAEHQEDERLPVDVRRGHRVDGGVLHHGDQAGRRQGRRQGDDRRVVHQGGDDRHRVQRRVEQQAGRTPCYPAR
ncbi:MAG: hypothetical protein U1F45_02055 [Burkholderiales bacterium]